MNLRTYYEPAPLGGIRAHVIDLTGDEWLALVAAIDDRADIIRRQKAERKAMEGGDLVSCLDLLAAHRAELHEINDRIKTIKALGA